ncbi:MAG: LemA family protein [Bacillota bacterium]|jgi:LemA protein
MKRYGWIIALGVVAILAFNLIGAYNRMVTLSQNVDNAWAQVNTQLQRRYDLIPQLVEAVKGYAAHEQEAISAVTEARAAMVGAQTPAAQQAAAAELEGALGRLLVVVEAYPQLQASTVFRDFMSQTEGTENRIAVRRELFNDEVTTYNTYIARFPNVLWARLFGFEKRALFGAVAGAENPPAVDFTNP